MTTRGKLWNKKRLTRREITPFVIEVSKRANYSDRNCAKWLVERGQKVSIPGIEKRRRRNGCLLPDNGEAINAIIKSRWSGINQSEELLEEIRELRPNITVNAIRKRAYGLGLQAKGRDYTRPARTTRKKKEVPMTISRIFTLVDGLDEYIVDSIPSGRLVSRGVRGLYDMIINKFGTPIKEAGCKLPFKTFFVRLKTHIWIERREKSLNDALNNGLKPEEWHKYNQDIPLGLVKQHANWLTGVSNKRGESNAVRQAKGLANFSEAFGGLSDVKFQENSFKKPFVIKQRRGSRSVFCLNGANIGAIHSRLIKENPVRRALADAEHRGDAAVIAVNLIQMKIVKAAGPLSVLRALAGGYNTNVGILDKDYQERAQKILDDAPDDAILYETDEEVAKNLMSGWSKIAIRPNGSPEYSGPIFCLLGYTEEALAAAIAYWRMAHITRMTQYHIENKLKVANTALAQAKQDDDIERQQGLNEEIEILGKEKSRTIISNIRDSEKKRYFRKALAYVVRMIEAAIPNAKVIGMGTTYFRYGKKVVEAHIPGTETVSSNILANYTKLYGPKVLRKEFADITVIFNPYALHYQSTVREKDGDGKRGSSEIITAPILIDDELVRSKLENTIRSVHNISRAVFNEQFRPGALRLVFTNRSVQPDELPIETLGTFARSRKERKGASKDQDTSPGIMHIPGTYAYPKYIWILLATDMHFGSRAKAWLRDPRTGMRLGMAESAFELIRRAGFTKGRNCPVHIFASLDDPTQGNHFEGHKHLSPREVPYGLFQKHLLEIKNRGRKAKTVREARDAMEEIFHFALDQKLLTPPDYVGAQMDQVL